MTVTQLYKKLGELIEKGSGRLTVNIDHSTFDTRFPELNIQDINDVDVETINICDGDGWCIVNKNGSTRTKSCVILKGEYK